jgi:hypothetical protein
MMRVSLRETRMVLERLVQIARVPEGMVPSLRDCALYSAALGLGGFGEVIQNLDLIREADFSRLAVKQDCALDAGELHAWLVAEIAVDLAVASKRTGGSGEVQIRRALRPVELGVAAGFAIRHGFAALIENGANHATILKLRPAAATDATLLDEIRRNGLPVDAELWWRLFHASSAALAPDTVSSRRHAGPIIITDDGRIVGRQDDDETDISLLTSGARIPEPNPAA